MTKKLLFALLVLTVTAQWLVPGKLIYDSEKTNAEGTSFKFRIRPVDPYDPFRGKYITLDFMDNESKRDTLESFSYGQSVFVEVSPDSGLIAKVKSISKNTPLGSDYFEATVVWVSQNRADSIQTVGLDFPFKKFFLEETVAPEAELTYAETRSDPGYALVSIMNGKAILRDVIIRDSSIVDVVRARRLKRGSAKE